MPFDGSGAFTRVHDWTTDQAGSVNPQASRFDAEDDGFATALNLAFLRDGRATATGHFVMGSYRITGLGVGTGLTDAATVSQILNQGANYITDTGAADAYVATLVPAATAYTAGMVVRFKAANSNTGTSTLNVNALGAKTIKKADGATNLVSGDIVTGQILEVVYDGTNFQVTNTLGQTYDSESNILANQVFN